MARPIKQPNINYKVVANPQELAIASVFDYLFRLATEQARTIAANPEKPINK